MFLSIESTDFVLWAIVCLFTALELFLGIGAEFESSWEIDHTRGLQIETVQRPWAVQYFHQRGSWCTSGTLLPSRSRSTSCKHLGLWCCGKRITLPNCLGDWRIVSWWSKCRSIRISRRMLLGIVGITETFGYWWTMWTPCIKRRCSSRMQKSWKSWVIATMACGTLLLAALTDSPSDSLNLFQVSVSISIRPGCTKHIYPSNLSTTIADPRVHKHAHY